MKVSELFSLEGKTAIVTGATGLLGKHYCKALAEVGARVVVADLNPDLCEEFAATLGDHHVGIAMDVTDQGSISAACNKMLDVYGRVDVLVNNAAINDMFESAMLAIEQSKFEYYPYAMWEQSWKVNVSGVFLCSQVFGSIMAGQGGGSIINIASTYGIVE